MSASTLIKVDGTAWEVATAVRDQISSMSDPQEMIKSLGLDYTHSLHNVKTDIDEPVPNYYSVYRDDTNKFLGIAVSQDPKLVQNINSFDVLAPLIEDGTLTPTCIDSYDNGRNLWGSFKYNETFDVLGDSFDQYIIAVNNHMKPNGNLTIINTPVRIACMNAMSFALSHSTLKYVLPASEEGIDPNTFTTTIAASLKRSQKSIISTANRLADIKMGKEQVEALMDDLFPFIPETESSTTNHDRANAFVNTQRLAFAECLKADNLANFNGTAYQIYNALTDFATHYYREGDKGFDVNNRMSIVPGFDSSAQTNGAKVIKFLKNVQKFAA